MTSWFSTIIFSIFNSFTSIFVVLASLMWLPWWMYNHFSSFCTILWLVTHSLHHHYALSSTSLGFWWWMHVLSMKTESYYKLRQGSKFTVSLAFHSEYMNIIWLNDWPVCYLLYVMYFTVNIWISSDWMIDPCAICCV